MSIAFACAASLGVAACGDGVDEASHEVTTVTVFAAASLTEALTEIGARFQDEYPGVVVEFSFSGSSDVVAHVRNGAPADVIATADEATMDDAAREGLLAAEPVPFATNVLQIVTPPDNPAGVDELADLAADDIAVVVCAPEVPCGAAAQRVATVADVDIAPVSEERSVTDVLGKVVSGEADAGLVYATDVLRAGDAVHPIAFPESAQAVNTYPIAPVSDSNHPTVAAAFVAFVTGGQGQQVMADAGFGQP